MKAIYLLPLMFATSIAIDYAITFDIQLTGPSAELCNYSELRGLVNSLEAVLEVEGNAYLRANDLPGTITDVEIYAQPGTRNLEEAAATEFMSASEEDVHEMEHRKLLFTWSAGGGAICRGCSPDTSDGRRSIRNLVSGEKRFSKTEASSFVNQNLKVDVPLIIKGGAYSPLCRNTGDEWGATFKWL